MNEQTPCPTNDPLMIAWNAYKATDDFANSKKWAIKGAAYADGSLWAAFLAGFTAATQRAGFLHENVNAASDAAMGAVIEYRDKIRQTIAAQ